MSGTARTMHELSIAQSICTTVAEYVAPHQRVLSVSVEIGPLSGVVPDVLEHCFGIIKERFSLSTATLDLRLIAAGARCPLCTSEFKVTSMWDECPECGHAPVTVDGGNELQVRSIEVGDEEEENV